MIDKVNVLHLYARDLDRSNERCEHHLHDDTHSWVILLEIVEDACAVFRRDDSTRLLALAFLLDLSKWVLCEIAVLYSPCEDTTSHLHVIVVGSWGNALCM